MNTITIIFFLIAASSWVLYAISAISMYVVCSKQQKLIEKSIKNNRGTEDD